MVHTRKLEELLQKKSSQSCNSSSKKPRLRPPIKLKSYARNQSPLYRLRNKKKLADLLSITVEELERLAQNADLMYKEFPVAKKSGGKRDVENPSYDLKVVQNRLARWLSRIAPPDYLYCPVKGRCYVSNAARHRGKRTIRCLDIRKYFPNTPSRRVFWFFNTVMQCDEDIAAIIAKISTYKKHLPTGSPLSPIMAYFAYLDVWEAIDKICNENGYILSVYIDDVTISADKISSQVVWTIKNEIHRAGLEYHKEKIFRNGKAEITGVIVDGYNITVPNRQRKKLKETSDALRLVKRDTDAKQLHDRLNGLRGQMAQVNAKA